MQEILAKDLKKQGIKTKTALKIDFNNKLYQRNKDFSQKDWDKAKELCQEYYDNNIDIN